MLFEYFDNCTFEYIMNNASKSSICIPGLLDEEGSS